MTAPLAERVMRGDLRAMARAISLVENDDPAGADLIRAVFKRTGHAYIVGVTGPPGGGKSTLVDRLTAEIRRGGATVGIVAVDPTSPFTGGAVLGDRLRMQGHSADEGVFIRSMATRGHLGGLSRATADAAAILDAAGRDVVVIETVGVGQDEVDIVRTADVSVVVLVPGTGDEVQALKAGIMEIADIFVVNKADREGADRLVAAVEANLSLHAYGPEEWRPPILQTVATSSRGVDELWKTITAFREHSVRTGATRRRRRGDHRLRELVAQRFMARLEHQVLESGEWTQTVERVVAGELDPYTAADALIGRLQSSVVSRQTSVGSRQSAVAFVAPDAPGQRISRVTLGELELISLYDGYFRLDGGSMFGVVPRTLWSAKAPADERNRIALAMRPLLVRGVRTLLIDAGLGDKENAKFADIYGVERAKHLDHALAEAGVSPDQIDIVLATHLHFDHAGGFTVRDASGRLRPRFPRAQYVVRRGEWEDATHPHERNRASYLADNFVPLAEAGVLTLVDDDQTIMPGVRVQRTPGHTAHHQSVWLQSGDRHALYVGDVIPTTAHVAEPWIMGFDLYPMDTLATKKALLTDIEKRDALIFFEHDPLVAAGHLRESAGKRIIQPMSEQR